mmetsp:Transcript_25/g.83  ORF Transcript_25/g.83 Transcript_25/m.83 type:complete len:573 (-) Transcript_25:180-1898(-)
MSPASLHPRRVLLGLLSALVVLVSAGEYADNEIAKTLEMRAKVEAELFDSMLIPANFVGWSLETTAARVMLFDGIKKDHVGLAPRVSYLQFLHNIVEARSGPLRENEHAYANTPFMIRLGGNSADQGCYEYHDSDPDSIKNGGLCEKNMTSADLRMYDSFANGSANFASVANATAGAANFKTTFIVGTNMAIRNPSWGAKEVAAMNALGLFERGVVQGIEIGNEVDSYFATQPNAKMMFFNGYLKAFAGYLDSYIEQGLPRKSIQGAVFADILRPMWGTGLRNYIQKYKDHLNSISIHGYPLTKCMHVGKEPEPVPMSKLVNRKASADEARRYSPFAKMATDMGIPFVLGEANSVSCGGEDGVSNTMGAALWALDFMAEMSKIRVSMINFHGGPSGPYAPIRYDKWTPNVQPLYYALLMFTEFSAGAAQWLSSSFAGETEDSASHAVRAANGDIRLLVVSKEAHAVRSLNFTAEIAIPEDAEHKYESATVFWLRSSVDVLRAKKEQTITYAGQTYESEQFGKPSGERTGYDVPLTVDRDSITIENLKVPHATAALVVIPARARPRDVDTAKA